MTGTVAVQRGIQANFAAAQVGDISTLRIWVTGSLSVCQGP